MIDLKNENFIYNTSKQIFTNEDSTVVQFRNEKGDGLITIHRLAKGITLMYNDFHMPFCKSDLELDRNIFCIDFCKEGIIEHQVKEDVLSYMKHNDIKFDRRDTHRGDYVFPIEHYHGITIVLDLNIIESSLKKEFPQHTINVGSILQKFYVNETVNVVSGLEPAINAFNSLYEIPSSLGNSFRLLKVIEILTILAAMRKPDEMFIRDYFKRSQVEKVKAIHSLITNNLDKNYTQEQLADKFNLSLSLLKKCFKGIYGKPMYAYLREYKMNKAATMLKNNMELTIGDIAISLGYENQGKFGDAFKDIRGVTPSEFREGAYGREENLVREGKND